MKSYLQSLRTLIGSRKIIHPGARIIVENKNGQILFIHRKDNGQYGIPAGALEEGESISACIKREVREETGIEIDQVELIGLSTRPDKESVEYPNGDQVQYFTVEFLATKWTGVPQADNQEVKEVFFKEKNFAIHIPPNEQAIFESLEYFRSTGKVRLD